MRKLDKVFIVLLILIIGFQSYANLRLLESIKSNSDFIYDSVMYPLEKAVKSEPVDPDSFRVKMANDRDRQKGGTYILIH